MEEETVVKGKEVDLSIQLVWSDAKIMLYSELRLMVAHWKEVNKCDKLEGKSCVCVYKRRYVLI